MIVVSDTSPLNYLILIAQQEVLPALFGRVVIPSGVAEELAHPQAPEAVRAWITHRPAWAEIRTPISLTPFARLGRGEWEAICIAAELNSDFLLIDDKPARRFAISRGLTITGTLGVLELAAARGLVDLKSAIQGLRETDYRISEHLLQAAIERDRQRHTRGRLGS